MAASERKRERRRKAMPKQRIPVPPPGFAHKAKNAYKRDNKIHLHDIEDDEPFYYDSDWDSRSFREIVRSDFLSLLLKFSILTDFCEEYQFWEWSEKLDKQPIPID